MVAATTKNRARGRTKQIKGTIKEAAGKASGNDNMKAAGRADRAEGKVQSGLGAAGEKVKDVARKVTGRG